MPSGAPRRYVIARLDGGDVAAIAGPGADPPTWRTYIAVDDADAAVPRLVSRRVGALRAGQPRR